MDRCIYFKMLLLIFTSCFLVVRGVWGEISDSPTGVRGDKSTVGNDEMPDNLEVPVEVDKMRDPQFRQGDILLTNTEAEDISNNSVDNNDLPPVGAESVYEDSGPHVVAAETNISEVREAAEDSSNGAVEDVGDDISVKEEKNESKKADVTVSQDLSEQSEVSQYLSEQSEVSQNLSVQSEVSQNLSKQSEVSQNLSEQSEVSPNLSKQLDVSQNLSEQSEVSQNLSEQSDVSQNLSEQSEKVKTSFSLSQNGTFIKENVTVSNSTRDPNTTTTSKPVIRWPCNPLTNISIDQFMKSDQQSVDSSVIIINNETMLTNLISAMNRTRVCGLLLFYSPYCEFCVSLAPLYNAVGRSYRDILVIASDAQNVMGVSAKYGIVGIPTILLFHSGKAVAKYNRSRTVADFSEFLLQLTGVTPSVPFNVTSDDALGPITSALKESRDYYLIFSICFILFVVLKGLVPFIKDSTVRLYHFIVTLFVRPKVD